ncbi:MAG: YciI family protein [Sediminibacterium sp.]
MKKRCGILMVLLCTILNTNAQNTASYNEALAKKTGADDYGMKQYVIAFLKKGTGNITDTAKISKLLAAHMSNMGKLAADGKLLLAGPMMDDTGLEGIFVFNVKTVEEAALLGQTDPAVKAKLFSIEYHPWYATAALMEVVGLHATLQKKKFR